MNSVYRGDFRNYASNNFRFIKNGRLLHYKSAQYGSYGLAFFFKGFQSGRRDTFNATERDAVNLLNKDLGQKTYIRGHIINSLLDGDLSNENLVPLTSSANANHETIETRLKRMIQNLNRSKFSAEEAVIGYEVEVNKGISQHGEIPRGITVNIDLYYISSETGELFKLGNPNAFGQSLLESNWNMRIPFSWYISN